MAIDAKQNFLNKVKEKCADKLTFSDMGLLLSELGDVLESYSVEEISHEKWNIADDDLLASFVSGMSVQGRSPNTLKRYTFVIGKFMEFANTPVRSINVYHIRNWLAAEKKRGVQDSTLEGDRQVLSSYFGWLSREGLIEKNPMFNVGAIKTQKKKKETYSEVDLDKLYRCCTNIRDLAIVHFLYSTGCRISEVTGLNRDTVNIKSLECVVNGKGSKDRTVYMDSITGTLLEEYLKSRKDSNEALFIGIRNERLTPGGVRAMLKKLGKEAGVNHVHPHKFRRTMATELVRHGMNIQDIAILLGHENIDTTMEYVILNKDDIKSSYRRHAA